jgi:hypothetical protein
LANDRPQLSTGHLIFILAADDDGDDGYTCDFAACFADDDGDDGYTCDFAACFASDGSGLYTHF